MTRLVSSTRKTPAKPSPNGTTAELKMLFARGIWSRATIGFRVERQSTSFDPAGRSSHGMAGAQTSLARCVNETFPFDEREATKWPSSTCTSLPPLLGRASSCTFSHFVCSCGTEARRFFVYG